MNENKWKNDESHARKNTTRILAIILVAVGALGLMCNFCAVPVGFANVGAGFDAFGRSVHEWGRDFGQTMGEMGREMGEFGRDFGQAMGEMGRDLGQGVGGMGQVVGRVFSSLCASVCALGLIGVGALLIFTRRSRLRHDARRKPKRDDIACL